MNNAAIEALEALTKIWKKNFTEIQPWTELWHCGRIPSKEHIDNNDALWTTRNSTKKYVYANDAKNPNSHRTENPTLLELRTVRKLKATTFNSVSLIDFHNHYCDRDHQKMKETLRQWCEINKIEAVVSINSDEDEVVIIYPANDLEILNAIPLNTLNFQSLQAVADIKTGVNLCQGQKNIHIDKDDAKRYARELYLRRHHKEYSKEPTAKMKVNGEAGANFDASGFSESKDFVVLTHDNQKMLMTNEEADALMDFINPIWG